MDELLDAAGRAFADLGVAKATMVDICRYAGCSRATLYRYFPNRSALHLAYVNRAALRIAAAISERGSASAADPATVLTDRIVAGIAGVRSDPLLAVWFEPENLSVPVALSQDSDVLAALAAGFIDDIGTVGEDCADLADHAVGGADDLAEHRGGWLLRSIVALLAMPAPDAATERALIKTFLVPGLIGPSNLGVPLSDDDPIAR